MRKQILIATNNPGKVSELSELLAGSSIDLISLADRPGIEEVEETGTTFAANAELKAVAYALQTGCWALADDSGLEVMALGGRPGVLSARYGGDGTSFPEKIRLLLDEMADTKAVDRRGRFVCSIAFASPNGEILFTAEGVCDGVLAETPRGMGGFGYDPLFIPDGYDKTFAELSPSVKRAISHRAKTFQEIIPFLRDFEAVRLDPACSDA